MNSRNHTEIHPKKSTFLIATKYLPELRQSLLSIRQNHIIHNVICFIMMKRDFLRICVKKGIGAKTIRSSIDQ